MSAGSGVWHPRFKLDAREKTLYCSSKCDGFSSWRRLLWDPRYWNCVPNPARLDEFRIASLNDKINFIMYEHDEQERSRRNFCTSSHKLRNILPRRLLFTGRDIKINRIARRWFNFEFEQKERYIAGNLDRFYSARNSVASSHRFEAVYREKYSVVWNSVKVDRDRGLSREMRPYFITAERRAGKGNDTFISFRALISRYDKENRNLGHRVGQPRRVMRSDAKY